ncbi:MAG: hypothetical protein Q8K63_14875 [Acidimicrobiales bacterium]|nr:hypothetical protein [Acidimicrobiales bacterium]
MSNDDEPDYLTWSPSKPADSDPDPQPAEPEAAPTPVEVPEPVAPTDPVDPPVPVVDPEPVDEASVEPPSVPDDYMPPTTDGTGFVSAQGFYKQNQPLAELSFDIERLSGDEKRLLSFRLTELNVAHRVEVDVLIAGVEAASTVQGQIDALVPEEMTDWLAPEPISVAPVVDEPVVERTEPEEIVVAASTDIDEVIESVDEDEDEIVFDLASLSTEERRHLSMRLTGAGIAHIWEVATDLVVAVKDAPSIEGYLEEVRNPDGFGDEELVAFDEDEDVDDEAVYAAMSNLYVAADKLMQRVNDPSIRTSFYDATDDVDGLPAPFGFDPRVWTQVLDLANSIADAMDEEVDDDAIATDARTLRQLLVNYV